MAYEKRVCVVKQIKKGFSADGGALTGAVYAERLGDELTITPRIAGLSPLRDGKYLLVFCAAGETLCLPLSGSASLRPEHAPSIQKGFSVLLCYYKGEAEPVAFGRCGAASESWQELLSSVTESKKRTIPIPAPPNQLPGVAPNIPLAPGVPLPSPLPPEVPGENDGSPQEERAAARYDDEAIAADNYFDDARDADAKAAPSDAQADGAAAHGDARDAFSRPRGTLTYYYSIKHKLEEAFRGEKDSRLLSVFPHSEWVRHGDALLGVVYEEGIPRYLCVAAEGDKPKEMEENAVFVPLSPFSEERGMWIVFQDADTGEYIKTSIE